MYLCCLNLVIWKSGIFHGISCCLCRKWLWKEQRVPNSPKNTCQFIKHTSVHTKHYTNTTCLSTFAHMHQHTNKCTLQSKCPPTFATVKCICQKTHTHTHTHTVAHSHNHTLTAGIQGGDLMDSSDRRGIALLQPFSATSTHTHTKIATHLNALLHTQPAHLHTYRHLHTWKKNTHTHTHVLYLYTQHGSHFGHQSDLPCSWWCTE